MKNLFNKKSPIFSLIILVFCCFMFVFLYRQIDINKNAYQNDETKWQQETERRNGIKLLNSSISKIEDEKNLLETHFAQSSDVVPFLDTMEATGAKVGVKAQVVLVDISKDGKNLVLEMKADGSFEGIYRFILLLENSPYELEFTSTDIQKNEITTAQGKKSNNWTADLKMNLLSFVP